ncbi:HypC/HybG/HupF family hydrogenase formation chaperone [Sphaerisporangium sp. TRM90804]|uniref:HypC/HybG/HupF family hydrogenase formation chaperone n=1 Tax=Sphaerisporangium sp. TRM90804 TaxID=3031113 RepID=UPI00244C7A88|nr:HypC/HybG/HupF family hydrogenase formation chaperone [Sphaerisporangium sp. TRM90804]MDH2429025.1 HypC/HybG/HupF family hydrogenase formation chaperone [Sphaerisporangium sp. TRM90804]
MSVGRAEGAHGGPGAGRGTPPARESCVTCSDEAWPALVVRCLEQDLAVVDLGGVRREVSVALVDAAPGDTVLVHAMEAIAVLARRGGDDGTG